MHKVYLGFFVLICFYKSYAQLTPLVTKDTLKVCAIRAKTLIPGMPAHEYERIKSVVWNQMPVSQPDYIPQFVDLSLYNSYTRLEEVIRSLTTSSIVKAFVSSLTSVDGRNIYAIEIGTGNELTLFTAGIHSREVANPQFIIKYAASLVNRFEKGDSAAILMLSRKRLVFIPCVNPDGYETAIKGKRAIRDTTLFAWQQHVKALCEFKANANGVDINRNFPSFTAGQWWDGCKKDNNIPDSPSPDFYGGPTLGSEPETRVAMSFLEKYLPQAHRYIDLHSAGRCIYAGKPLLSPQFNQLSAELSKQINKITGYTLLALDKEHSGEGADGTITDYAAELCAGYQFDSISGRIAALNYTVSKPESTIPLLYPTAIATVETTAIGKGGGLHAKSTVKMQETEWRLHHLFSFFEDMVMH